MSVAPTNSKRRQLIAVVLAIAWIVAIFSAVVLVGEHIIGPNAEASWSWIFVGRTG